MSLRPGRTERAVITGIGVICGLGRGRERFVRGLRDGRCGIEQLTLFPADGFGSPWAGQIPCSTVQLRDELAAAGQLHADRTAPCTRTELLCLAAGAEAVAEAGLTPRQLADTPVLVGSGGGSDLVHPGQLPDPERFAERLVRQQPTNAANLLAGMLRASAPRLSVMTACSSSAMAVGLALDAIRLGRAEIVIAGGCEALTALTFGGFSALKAMDSTPCRPFHIDRRGLTLGEAAAVLVIEKYDHAVARGAAVYAEVAGYGVSCDAYHLTSPAPDGRGALVAMRAALKDAQLRLERLGYINAHGTGTPLNDQVESRAIKALLDEARPGSLPAVSSTKATTGHTLAAAGALEIAACAVAIRHRFIPATLRLGQIDPACEGLDLVANRPRLAHLEAAMSNSFAFGGHNVSVVLAHP